jgi:hypothetical protein
MIKINHTLPIYDILINPEDETGMKFVSLVDDPAIEMKGFAFSADEKNMMFTSNKDKQVIVGPAMIPNKLIYRKDEDGEYYVKFPEATIRDIADKFMKQNDVRRINVDHSNKMVEGYIQQFWIVEDSTYDKARFYGLNVPKGTLMMEVKIEDENFWNEEVKLNGKFGFSIEGLLGQKLVKMSIEESIEETIENLTDNEILDLFSDYIGNILNKNGK